MIIFMMEIPIFGTVVFIGGGGVGGGVGGGGCMIGTRASTDTCVGFYFSDTITNF